MPFSRPQCQETPAGRVCTLSPLSAAGGQGQGPGCSRDSPRFQRKSNNKGTGNTMAAAENSGAWPCTLYFLAQRRGIVEIKQINSSLGLELKRLLAFLCFSPPAGAFPVAQARIQVSSLIPLFPSSLHPPWQILSLLRPQRGSREPSPSPRPGYSVSRATQSLRPPAPLRMPTPGPPCPYHS